MNLSIEKQNLSELAGEVLTQEVAMLLRTAWRSTSGRNALKPICIVAAADVFKRILQPLNDNLMALDQDSNAVTPATTDAGVDDKYSFLNKQTGQVDPALALTALAAATASLLEAITLVGGPGGDRVNPPADQP